MPNIETAAAPRNTEEQLVGLPGDPTSDVDPSVTTEQLCEALLTHCRTSRDQLREIEQANASVTGAAKPRTVHAVLDSES